MQGIDQTRSAITVSSIDGVDEMICSQEVNSNVETPKHVLSHCNKL